ncbi:hypothetical protein A3860_10920 [Niastella vici]|uniref:Uncharacterized protein n=1 Tax=Niastella vici TaxID=1703345 RepID=A0A1V9FFM4_9BACT|nr:hypothetical protein [Niastella vici]OQP57071.1 hypothetical protein A3860_10920 [Niastella vici]
MKTGIYKIAEQIGNYGFYGEIEIEVEITSRYQKVELEFDDELERWQSGVLFGATYFLEHCMSRIGLNIRVKEIKYNELDTSNTIVAYLTFKALVSATNLELKSDILFDKEFKAFVFPK